MKEGEGKKEKEGRGGRKKGKKDRMRHLKTAGVPSRLPVMPPLLSCDCF